jgi:site-specific DNA-methyltransferase (adenine-specific)
MIQGENYTVHIGNNLDILPTLKDCSVDSIVTDPPYELGFMGKKWDNTGIAYNTDLWRECLRVLKPGGHLLSFGGTRTWHRVAVAIEDAGFEVRDSIAWMYGSGYPKSLDVSKAIEGKITTGSSNKKDFKNLNGEQVERGDWGIAKQQFVHGQRDTNYDETAGETRLGKLEATTPEAKQWEGWGTALKPAFEPIVVARKPLIGTVAENVLTYGTGGLNIDASRIGTEKRKNNINDFSNQHGNNFGNGERIEKLGESEVIGRWPANVILDEYSAELLDEQSGTSKAKPERTGPRGGRQNLEGGWNKDLEGTWPADPGGGASRFFYVAKASKRDRNEGLEDLPEKANAGSYHFREDGSLDGKPSEPRSNFHPTVKPTALMEYLIKLVTPPQGIVLDPFTGSGSTGKAAILNGFQFIGIEMTEDYIPIIEGRLKHAADQKSEGLF